MITYDNNLFILETKDSSYLFKIDEEKHLTHLYYGKKIVYSNKIDEILGKNNDFALGNSISFDEEHPSYNMENRLLELSFDGHGDARNLPLEMELDGNSSFNFIYHHHQIRKHVELENLPHSRSQNDELAITLVDEINHLEICLIYCLYEEDNIITRRMEITSHNHFTTKILKAMSLMLDIPNSSYQLTSFHGGWINEMNKFQQDLVIGTINNESRVGTSSSRTNPFIMINQKNTNEEDGLVYGFNLIYSGNHLESVETDIFSHLRIMCGINPYNFTYFLNENETFYTPEAIMSFSHQGYNLLSKQFHHFIENYLIEKDRFNLPRPILNNSWEGTYFNFTENKILKMAKAASKAGIELFVLDDGWFSSRNDDAHGLGDWNINQKKLPNGLKHLVDKINDMGMDFGLWIEPEMVNNNTKLYQEHPSWVIENHQEVQSLGRHQYILDLSNPQVVDYLFATFENILSSCNIKYVKWDMNRIFSSYYSSFLPKEKMKELSYRYYLGLYALMNRLNKRFPHILFESCASGGNRFDLGILFYHPQIWGSDNTDAFSRMKILKNYSYGYPLSCIGSHVTSKINHQTLREYSLQTRFHIALMGNLGYEFDFSELNKKDFALCQEQIALYKEIRTRLINPTFYRLELDQGKTGFYKISQDKTYGILVIFYENVPQIVYEDKIRLEHFDENLTYKISTKVKLHSPAEFGTLINTSVPFHIKMDSLIHKIICKKVVIKEEQDDLIIDGKNLNNCLLTLNYPYIGTGFNQNTKLLNKPSSTLFIIEKID